MMGVAREYQELGVGEKLMQTNFDLLTKSRLGETVSTVSLTSDPLVSRNMYFYLHKSQMSAKRYITGAYAEEKRDLEIPSDRLVFVRHPKSEVEGKRQTNEYYKAYQENHPKSFVFLNQSLDLDSNPLICIEIPNNANHAENLGYEVAINWIDFNRRTLPVLF